MDSGNSKNITFIVALLIVVSFVFGYLLFSNNVDKTVYTNISQYSEDD